MGQVFGICYLVSYHRCNLMNVVDDIAFYPPNPPHYSLEEKNGKIQGEYWILEDEMSIPESVSIHLLPVDKGISICMMHYKSNSSKWRVLLYSHGNAVDLGLSINSMILLGSKLDCDVMFYDYEGYGYSNGDVHGKNIPRDLRAVYNYARQFFEGKDIFFAGESIGSVPTCYVAGQLWDEYNDAKEAGSNPSIPVAGIILHAALYTGSSFPGGCLIQCCDPLNNAKMIQKVQCPVFHIHGTEDETVPFALGKQLYELSHSEFEPWWVPGATHLDIVINHPTEYFSKYSDFFAFCEKKYGKSASESILHSESNQKSASESIHHSGGNQKSASESIHHSESDKMEEGVIEKIHNDQVKENPSM